MNINKVCGEFPDVCYKMFNCKKYAEDFIYRGAFRLHCLGYYRNMEDKLRRDVTEGYGHTIEPDTITVGLVSSNLLEETIWREEIGDKEHHIGMGTSVFCFCTCLPDVDRVHMLKTFGRYIVKINEPKKLAEDINNYFISKGQKLLIEGCKVVYNKGQKLEKKLTNNERVDISYKQKPENFSPDREFRIVAIKIGELCKEECKYLDGQSEPECKFIEVNLGMQLDYTQLQNS